MVLTQDQRHMQAALHEAEAAAERDEVPVGAVVVDENSGDIIARSGNRTRELHDPSAHAEMLCLRHACAANSARRIPGHCLYVTLEPCPMCTAALAYARIKRIVFGARDSKSGGLISGPDLARSPVLHHKFKIEEGLYADESRTLLQQFFAERR